MIAYKTIQYIRAKYPAIHNELKALNLNKSKFPFFQGTISYVNPPINLTGVFMMNTDGQLYLLQAPKADDDRFMVPVSHTLAMMEAVNEARNAAKGKYQHLLLASVNRIERLYGLEETAPTKEHGTTLNKSNPLF